MNRTAKRVLLGLWALLFVLCGIDGVTQAQKAAFLSRPVAQVLGALYFLNLYGLLALGWKFRDRKLLKRLWVYGIAAIGAYVALLLLWLLSWTNRTAYRVTFDLFSFFTAPLPSFYSMAVCIALWAGLFVVGLMLYLRAKPEKPKIA